MESSSIGPDFSAWTRCVRLRLRSCTSTGVVSRLLWYRVKVGMSPVAEPLAKYVFAVSKEKERLFAEVESVVYEGREHSD